MKPEAQRIAIAEACGWTKVPNSRGRRWCRHYLSLGPHHSLGSLPDYLTDLNAMHEAEKVLTQEKQREFLGHLSCKTEGDELHTYHWNAVHATAAQRAEAFLRTLGKWEDGE